MSALAGFDELRAVVAEYASTEGNTQGGVPGLWFFRADRPSMMCPSRVVSLYTGFIVQGRKRIRVAGQDIVFGPPSYVVVTGEADFEAQVVEASPERPYLSCGLVMPPELVAETLIELARAGVEEDAGQATPAAYTSRLTPPLLDALLRLLRAQNDPVERRVLAPLRLRELVFHLLRGEAAATLRSAVQRSGDALRIREAMAFMREHAHERLTVERVARRFGMSASHFAHRFREVARVSPIRYVKHVRLERARTLMLHEGKRPSEVAERVGYASTSQFSRDFKTHFGVPPAGYVRRCKEGTESAIAESSKTFAAQDMVRARATA